MEKLYSLAPYFRVGFKNQLLICGFGSIQKKIKNVELQNNIIKVLEYVKHPRKLSDIKVFLNITFNNKNTEKIIYRYLIEKNWLIEHNLYIKNHRYSRNFLHYSLSGENPSKVQGLLKEKHVIILGCGGIGNIVSVGLATAGIGKLTLVDDDSIELSNLSRQFMFKEGDIGKKKLNVLKESLIERNSNIQIECLNQFIDKENINNLPKADLIVLSADSYNILKIIYSYSIKYDIPAINIGYIEDIASWGPMFIPGKTGCLFCQSNLIDNNNLELKLQQSIFEINKCYQAPSNGPLNLLSSSFALIDIIKFLGEYGEVMSINQRLGVWTHNFRIQKQDCTKNINCHICGKDNK